MFVQAIVESSNLFEWFIDIGQKGTYIVTEVGNLYCRPNQSILDFSLNYIVFNTLSMISFNLKKNLHKKLIN